MTDSKNMFVPDYVVAPGDVAKEHIEWLGWSEEEFAERCDLPIETINGVFGGTTGVTRPIASRFERVLGVKAYIWLRLEQMYQGGLDKGKVRIGECEAQYPTERSDPLDLATAH